MRLTIGNSNFFNKRTATEAVTKVIAHARTNENTYNEYCVYYMCFRRFVDARGLP